MSEWINKVAITSGAASGMGLLFAQNWAALGGNVVMCDISEAVLNEKVAEINAKGQGRAVGVLCDVRDYAQVCHVRDVAVETFGRIDVMVSFAGGSSTRIWGVDTSLDFPNVPIEVYDWGIDVNLKGPFYFAHAVMNRMREQRSGLIINIGSIAGAEGANRDADYSMSKAGLMYGLTKSLAQAGEAYGVRCVCISPGPVLTRPGMAAMRTMLRRAAEPQEIIDLVLFVASDKGQFINGENIMIDGGRNASAHLTY